MANHSYRHDILVVEDDSQTLRALTRQLSRAGFRVRSANTALECVRLARRHRPSAISLDVRLPDMDGTELAARLRQDPATWTIPIVFVTGKADAYFKEICQSVGARFFLRKPYDVDLLIHAMRTACASHDAAPSDREQSGAALEPSHV